MHFRAKSVLSIKPLINFILSFYNLFIKTTKPQFLYINDFIVDEFQSTSCSPNQLYNEVNLLGEDLKRFMYRL